MAQNYRNQPNRPESWRGGRYQTGGERDRYRTGGEQRFSPERGNYGRQSRGFEGDRSYPQGGYSEEFGYQRGRNRDDNDEREFGDERAFGGRNYGSRGSSGTSYQSERSYGGDFDRQRQSRYDEDRFDEGNRRGEASDDRDYDTELTRAHDARMSWREDLGQGGYFNTGNYIDDGDAWRGFGRDFERARVRAEREDDIGSFRGASRGYEERSSWDYGPSREMQSFRGRGPQGYRRSDERLKEMICERLTDDPMIDASDVTVEVKDQSVKLTGTVDDRGTKYEIEELIEHCGGVKDIDNQVRVRTSRWDFGGQQARGGSDWEAGSSSTSTSGRTPSGSGSMSTSGSTGKRT